MKVARLGKDPELESGSVSGCSGSRIDAANEPVADRIRLVAQGYERIDGAVRNRSHEFEELLGGNVVVGRVRMTSASRQHGSIQRTRARVRDPRLSVSTWRGLRTVKGGTMSCHPVEDLAALREHNIRPRQRGSI